MSDMQGRAPPTTSNGERQQERTTSDTNIRPRLSIEEATFLLHILKETRESATKKVNWDRAAAAVDLPSADAARGKYGDIHTRMGWHIPEDAQLEQPTDKRHPAAEAATKATMKKEPEDSDDDSEGGVKVNNKREPADDGTDNSDGGVRLIQKETEKPAGDDWLLTKPFQLPTRHPASRGPASGRPSRR